MYSGYTRLVVETVGDWDILCAVLTVGDAALTMIKVLTVGARQPEAGRGAWFGGTNALKMNGC